MLAGAAPGVGCPRIVRGCPFGVMMLTDVFAVLTSPLVAVGPTGDSKTIVGGFLVLAGLVAVAVVLWAARRGRRSDGGQGTAGKKEDLSRGHLRNIRAVAGGDTSGGGYLDENHLRHADGGGGAGGGRVALVVEDDDGLRELYVRTLSDAGWRVVASATAERALGLLDGRSRQAARRWKTPELNADADGVHDPGVTVLQVAVLVADLSLPGMDGARMADEVTGVAPGVAVVFVSGYDPSSFGVSDNRQVLAKPFEPDHLVAAVQRAVDGGWEPPPARADNGTVWIEFLKPSARMATGDATGGPQGLSSWLAGVRAGGTSVLVAGVVALLAGGGLVAAGAMTRAGQVGPDGLPVVAEPGGGAEQPQLVVDDPDGGVVVDPVDDEDADAVDGPVEDEAESDSEEDGELLQDDGQTTGGDDGPDDPQPEPTRTVDEPADEDPAGEDPTGEGSDDGGDPAGESTVVYVEPAKGPSTLSDCVRWESADGTVEFEVTFTVTFDGGAYDVLAGEPFAPPSEEVLTVRGGMLVWTVVASHVGERDVGDVLEVASPSPFGWADPDGDVRAHTYDPEPVTVAVDECRRA